MNPYKKQLDIKLREEIDSLYISQSTKDNLEKVIFGSLSFYTYLPLDILKRAQNNELYIDRTIDLSMYAALYVAAIVCTDKMLDKKLDEKSTRKLMIEYIFFIKEHAIRGLQRTLGDEVHYWTSLDNLIKRIFDYSSSKNHVIVSSKKKLLSHLLNNSSLIEGYITSMQAIIPKDIKWNNNNSGKGLINTSINLNHFIKLLLRESGCSLDCKINQINYI